MAAAKPKAAAPARAAPKPAAPKPRRPRVGASAAGGAAARGAGARAEKRQRTAAKPAAAGGAAGKRKAAAAAAKPAAKKKPSKANAPKMLSLSYGSGGDRDEGCAACATRRRRCSATRRRRSATRSPAATHVVPDDNHVRTRKVLVAAARGVPVVKEGWVNASLEAGGWLPCADFLARPQVERPGTQLVGKRFFVASSHVLESKEQLEGLIRLAGGEVVATVSRATHTVGYAGPTGGRAKKTAEEWVLDRVEGKRDGEPTQSQPVGGSAEAPAPDDGDDSDEARAPRGETGEKGAGIERTREQGRARESTRCD